MLLGVSLRRGQLIDIGEIGCSFRRIAANIGRNLLEIYEKVRAISSTVSPPYIG